MFKNDKHMHVTTSNKIIYCLIEAVEALPMHACDEDLLGEDGDGRDKPYIEGIC